MIITLKLLLNLGKDDGFHRHAKHRKEPHSTDSFVTINTEFSCSA